MRLTCPNCGAQYEVPDEVIPVEGRDVQCSNCGDTWFQLHPSAAASDDLGVDLDDSLDDSDALADLEEALAEDPQDDETPEDDGDADWDEAEVDDIDDAAVADPEPQKPKPDPEPQDDGTRRPRGLDPAITSILREEADREAHLRAAETGGLESQPDLGLVDTDDAAARDRRRQSEDRMAQMRGETPTRAALDARGPRREQLPDIEEINSTLRAGAEKVAPSVAKPDEDAPVARRRSGFGRGFLFAILMGVALVFTYANAPQIAQSLPQADPFLSAFVASVDQARLWLDAKVSLFVTQQ